MVNPAKAQIISFQHIKHNFKITGQVFTGLKILPLRHSYSGKDSNSLTNPYYGRHF
jgi:hypothetical protein